MATSIALVPLQGEELLGRVDELVEKIGENFFELGQHLFEIKAGEVYRERGHDSWVAWCDEALPFQWRKADHYIELWELYCQKLGYDYNELAHVGWSKLVKVKGLITNKRDAKKWIGHCEQNGRRAIETMVKHEHARRRAEDPADPTEGPSFEHVSHDTDGELKGIHEGLDTPFVDPSKVVHLETEIEDEETGETVPLHQFQVYLFSPQWKNVMAAMNRAGQLSNSDKACYLLDLIATEFNTTFAETLDGGVAQRLENIIKNLERVFEVQITVEVPRNSKLRKMSRLDDSASAKPAKKKARKKKAKKKKKEKKAKKEKTDIKHRW